MEILSSSKIVHDFHFHWVFFLNNLSFEATNWPSFFAFLSFLITMKMGQGAASKLKLFQDNTQCKWS